MSPAPTPWFEDERFWRNFYTFLFPPDRFEAAREQVDQILKLTGFEGRDILDLCCGPARHSCLLAERGYRVTGVDRSPFLLAKAREFSAEKGVSIEFVEQDMRTFARPDSFDLALSLFTSFGYFAQRDEDVQVLRNLYASLRRGGCLVIDMAGKEPVARKWQPTLSRVQPDGSVLVEIAEILDSWTRVRTKWMLIRGDSIARHTIELNLYSGLELEDRLRATGFAGVKLYGDLSGAEYGPDATRLVAVARKA